MKNTNMQQKVKMQETYGDTRFVSEVRPSTKVAYVSVEVHTKSQVESASSPLVEFVVLNDNLIKGLISCIKCISRILMKVQTYSLIHHLNYNYEANGTM
jgi:hypothetical protein